MAARVVINKSQIASLLSNSPKIQKELERKVQLVLEKAKELAPRDTGDLANSLSYEKTIENGRIVYRIVSSDPQLKDILKGTNAPYSSIPPWGEHSQLGAWGIRHGFVTSRSRYNLARSIARHGTNPAGSFNNKQEWIKEVLRQSRL